jgi:hypothetical protein
LKTVRRYQNNDQFFRLGDKLRYWPEAVMCYHTW